MKEEMLKKNTDNTEGSESSEGWKDPKDPKDPEETEGTESSKDPEGTEGSEDPEDPEGTEGSEGSEDSKDPEDPEGTTESSKGPEGPKEPKGTEGTESSKDLEGSKENKDYPLKEFYQKIYGRYDLVNRIFTFGQDRNWRKKAVEECLGNAPRQVLDICTGTGDLVLELAEVNGNIQFTGYDFSAEMLEKAKEKASAAGKNIDFIEGNVAEMPFDDNRFDTAGITFGIRNLVYENSNAEKHLAEVHRVLRMNGRLVVLESSKPDSRIWRFFNGIYLQLILPWLGGLISGNLKAYRYLAKSSQNYYSRKEMAAILEQAGFRVIRSRPLFLGSVMLLVAEKQGNE